MAGMTDPDRIWTEAAGRLRSEIGALVAGRRYNLQEILAREVYDLIAARRGVTALRVSTRKPDIYPDCAGVGVELSSFAPEGA